jgi:hypothetical protein
MKSPTIVLTAAAFALGVLGQIAQAQEIHEATGPFRTGAMMASCRAFVDRHKPHDAEAAFKEGVCAGVVETVMRLAPGMNATFRFCPPREATLAQALPVLVEFIEADPKMLKYDLRDVASLAFRRTWPCQ